MLTCGSTDLHHVNEECELILPFCDSHLEPTPFSYSFKCLSHLNYKITRRKHNKGAQPSNYARGQYLYTSSMSHSL